MISGLKGLILEIQRSLCGLYPESEQWRLSLLERGRQVIPIYRTVSSSGRFRPYKVYSLGCMLGVGISFTVGEVAALGQHWEAAVLVILPNSPGRVVRKRRRFVGPAGLAFSVSRERVLRLLKILLSVSIVL